MRAEILVREPTRAIHYPGRLGPDGYYHGGKVRRWRERYRVIEIDPGSLDAAALEILPLLAVRGLQLFGVRASGECDELDVPVFWVAGGEAEYRWLNRIAGEWARRFAAIRAVRPWEAPVEINLVEEL